MPSAKPHKHAGMSGGLGDEFIATILRRIADVVTYRFAVPYQKRMALNLVYGLWKRRSERAEKCKGIHAIGIIGRAGTLGLAKGNCGRPNVG